ncbi:beta-mannosidase-like protein [Xylogone sp. PMI_703]|nr:beta-mannosidase-like protein [Xylogone sp. PMI_703]
MSLKGFKELSLSSFQWWYREESSSEQNWTPCKTFPTVIHYELEQAGMISDPFVGLNEKDSQWVGLKDWSFRTSFPTPDDVSSYASAVLAFEGLDTIAQVQLNGHTILESDNAFTAYTANVREYLRPGGQTNELYIIFTSNARVAKDREAKYGKLESSMRDSSRVWMRKPQFHWGWDWGPIEITCGPHRDISLQLYSVKIDDVHVKTKIDYANSNSTISVSASLVGVAEATKVQVVVCSPTGEVCGFSTVEFPAGSNTTNTNFVVKNPQLWWPANHGDQPLYKAVVTLTSQGDRVDERSLSFGIREIKVIQRPLQSSPGTTFFFEINKRPIYIVGTNWVPAHNQRPVVTAEKYRKWVLAAKANNNNMIRIWGGGYFEGDEFYDYCDQEGILIWHDLMTACGVYPTEKFFTDSTVTEVRYQVKRLRNHPCIAIWCGNNEDFMMADRRGDNYDLSDTTGPWEDTPLPHRLLYMKLWPDIISELAPDTFYWPSSPWGLHGREANDPTVGDLHQWNVWHGCQEHYQQYPKLGGRFVSEFGMHGFPDIRTVRVFVPDESEVFPNSRLVDSHNKSKGAEQKQGHYLWANFKAAQTMQGWIYLSQLMQAEALDYAIIHWRRDWKGEGSEENAGTLIWQLNDSNPTVSWALLDYYFRPKAAFFTTKRAFAPINVGISRDPVWHHLDDQKPRNTDIPTFQIWASNISIQPREVELRIRMFDIIHGQEIYLPENISSSKYTIAANKATEMLQFRAPAAVQEDSRVVITAQLFNARDGTVIARKDSWPEPFRYIQNRLPRGEAGSPCVIADGERVTIQCGNFPVKGLLAFVGEEGGEDAEWSDNMFDLFPGDRVQVIAKGLAARKVQLRHLARFDF